MEDVFFAVLFINAVDGNFEKSFFSVEFVFSIVSRESDGYIYAVARVMTDELFFKVIDKCGSRSQDQRRFLLCFLPGIPRRQWSRHSRY